MKTAKQLKRLSPQTLSRYALDLEDEIRVLQAALALAKREQRSRRKTKVATKKCGRKTSDCTWQTAMDSSVIH